MAGVPRSGGPRLRADGRDGPRGDGGEGRPVALLFDWDNTLADTWPAIHHALAVTFRAMDREPWTFEETRRRVRASARDSFPALFGARAEEAMAIFYGCFESDHLAHLRERPGATDMLERLHAAGFYLAVVSNKRGDLLRQEADALDWTRLFRRLVGANDAARDKPAAEPVHLALGHGSMAPGPDIWFVGDTDIDLACAANSGCVPVLLRAEPPLAGEFADHPPHRYFDSCAALARLLTAGGS
ncbi:MAG TPA: HAD family hydrolase [Kiloniellales bacterium]